MNLRLTMTRRQYNRIRIAKALTDSLYADVLNARDALKEVESKYEEAQQSWEKLQESRRYWNDLWRLNNMQDSRTGGTP